MALPFVLLDDARSAGAGDAWLYRDPVELVVARQPDEVAPALARVARLVEAGAELAGVIAYEAGLALEPRLRRLADRRCGAAGPLVWMGRFARRERLTQAEVTGWLAAEAQVAQPARCGPLTPQISAGGYARAFAALREAILAGDIYQANLALQLGGSWRGDPLALYAAIRSSAGAGHGGIVCDDSHWLLSFSPELFFAADAASVEARPMKGTRPRAADPTADAAAAGALAASAKDRAEHLMIVDLVRNDLSRVAEPGSVRVERPFAVESYPTVHQMTTTVRARLRPHAGIEAVVRALFPCGSITGAPKLRAMELIDALERDARGPYCGAIGRIGGGANVSFEAEFNVAIRTLRLDPASGRATLGVGSAVVADSTVASEWRECLLKGDFVARSPAAGFDLVETMRFAPDDGVPLIELHLARMQASAAELGFAFDRHVAANAIHALCFDALQPGKVRLLLARSGAWTVELAPLPAPLPEPARVVTLSLPVDAGDWRLRHKTTDRAFYDAGRRAAEQAGADEAVFVRDDGLVTEGSFTSLFVADSDGRLRTPPSELGVLPGVLRRSLLEEGRAVEAELTLANLEGGFFLGNALRGLVAARLLGA
jgi:para-aminobenzoate synthetase/4-amino-4-deoxychorismate lyase